MKWKYFVPHVWQSPEERTFWEDVWLLPEDDSDGKSYWFTLNALTLGAAGVDEPYPEGDDAVREMNLRLLGDRDYFITPKLDMVARVEDFDLHELLEWTVVFIREHFGDPSPELVEGAFADFAGTNNQAAAIGRIEEALEWGVPEEDVIMYRPPRTERDH